LSSPIFLLDFTEKHKFLTSPLTRVQFAPECQPILTVMEPPEYFCASTQCISFFNETTNTWEEKINFDLGQSITAKLPYFSLCALHSLRYNDQFVFDKNLFDPAYDFDFTNIDDGTKIYYRGNKPYKRPCGMRRFALKVLGKYDNGNDRWLSTEREQDVWIVAYHSTRNIENVMNIHKQAVLKPGGGQIGGQTKESINLTYDPEYALNITKPTIYYHNGHKIEGKLIFQARIHPNCYSVRTQNSISNEKEWLVKDPNNIRLYNLLIKEKIIH